jgi:hypothetical protein
MSSLPSSFSIAVDAKRRACVLDTHLALSPYGLLLAQRLSSELDLWLVRELWQILDNTQYYLTEPDQLRPAIAAAAPLLAQSDAESLRDTLTQWEAARTETDLAGLNIHWIGDALSESMLPARVDPHLVSRFETLARSLDRRVQQVATDRAGVLVDCARDAVALTAALMPYRAFILTARAGENGAAPDEPALCSQLRAWGVRSYCLGASARIQLEREYVLPMFGRAGVAELMWAGLKLAAVHVLAPKAVMVPRRGERSDLLDADLEPAGEGVPGDVDWWNGAVSFWYPLGPAEEDSGH